MSIADLLDVLHYQSSPCYIRTGDASDVDNTKLRPLLRTAQLAGVHGIYVFKTDTDQILAHRPAVFVAQANDVDSARSIHKRLWNLGQAPFLIVILPNHVRVYTGFDYSPIDEGAGLLDTDIALDRDVIRARLVEFEADAIDDGQLWQRLRAQIDSRRRVDMHLLNSLANLGEELRRQGLQPHVAHSLIGKYVYIRYLRDRRILSDEWLRERGLDYARVAGREATAQGLQRLTSALEKRFNGKIFPIDFDHVSAPTDAHVSLTARIFKGDRPDPSGAFQLAFDSEDSPLSTGQNQLVLDFRAFDFQYIPIELLSSIYEQFLQIEERGRKIGAYYTPEPLADYLLSEVHSATPLRLNSRILDPSCGSGVLLVLTYRRLVEMELAQSSGPLPSQRLLHLMRNLYGVERELDACHVAEFSLILTLLDYIDPPELHANASFKFPDLHNHHIFQCDFFQPDSAFARQGLQFDWIVGNPPWVDVDFKKPGEEPVKDWMLKNKAMRPVGGNDVAEAFSWRAGELVKPGGCIGLIMPAKSLFNHESVKYRRRFFSDYTVLRVTNFANVRHELFGGRAVAPAVTLIYRRSSSHGSKPGIIHYGPFAINQITRTPQSLWTITVNESEIKNIAPDDVANGDASAWKMALWGSYRDERTIAQLRRLFPLTLEQLCHEKSWALPAEGVQLREYRTSLDDQVESMPQLEGKNVLDTNKMNGSSYRFSVPLEALDPIPKNRCYIRKRGGKQGLIVSEPPRLLMSAAWKYTVYTDQFVLIPPRQIGLSCPPSDAKLLRALSAFLNSSVVRYYLFFQVPDWGIERDRITLRDVKGIPLPRFTPDQVVRLERLHQEMVGAELDILTAEQDTLDGAMADRMQKLQVRLDAQIADICAIPDHIRIMVTDFRLRELLLVTIQRRGQGGEDGRRRHF